MIVSYALCIFETYKHIASSCMVSVGSQINYKLGILETFNINACLKLKTG